METEFKGSDIALSYEELPEQYARVVVLDQGALLNGHAQQDVANSRSARHYPLRREFVGPSDYLFETDDLISLDDKSSWVQAAFESLGGVVRLRRDWDSYGSPPITDGARRAAIDLILLLSTLDLPHADVVPVPGGGIQFEWELDSRELELELAPDGLMAV
jgi:hypothetical protein